jgi:hypothetical protein
MKTTIFPGILNKTDKKDKSTQALHIINLILVLNYLIVNILLVSVPVRHGYGSGMGGGMGNAINLSLPSFLILFSILIIFHLISFFQTRIPVWLSIGIGFGQVITGAMTLGLLIFSRQSSSLLNVVYPAPILVFGSLALSVVLGIFIVVQQVRVGQVKDTDTIAEGVSIFPLPLKRYRNVHILTEGGVGTIWYAERVEDDLAVVVKVPKRTDEKTGMSFMQEISLWKDLDHANIAIVFSANILPVPYMEIEYLPESLAEIKKPVSISQALFIIKGLVSALIYAHGQGVSHCDIKPSNILLTKEGVPKLTDWGLARSGSSRWSVSGFSPSYAAPEQLQIHPECSFSTDIWQIGMLLVELLTGSNEVLSDDERISHQENGTAVLHIIHTCLSVDPKDRYPSAQALYEELNLNELSGI